MVRETKRIELKAKRNKSNEVLSKVTAHLLYENDNLLPSESTVVKEYYKGYPDRISNVFRERGNMWLAYTNGAKCIELYPDPDGSVEDQGFCVHSRYLEGKTVEKVLHDPRLDVTDQRLVLRSTIYCLATLHSAGVLMWDTHPSNFIVHHGEVYACDFELSRSTKYPFTSPPPTSPRPDYYSSRQNLAIQRDLDKNGLEELECNHLQPRDDFYVFASEVLKIGMEGTPLLKDAHLRTLLSGMKDMKFPNAQSILEAMGTPAPEENLSQSVGYVTGKPSSTGITHSEAPLDRVTKSDRRVVIGPYLRWSPMLIILFLFAYGYARSNVMDIAIHRIRNRVSAFITAPPKGKPASDPVTNIELVRVPGGRFSMGNSSRDALKDEKPSHEVTLDDFEIGKYEVTQGQWKAIMGNNPSFFKSCGDVCPVENVSWKDVQEFLRRLNSLSERTYRLPTEAEWEYAARSGGKLQKYSGSNSVDAVAWYSQNSEKKTHRVGMKRPNQLGIYDMSGNVWEWCQDVYDPDYYRYSGRNDPPGPPPSNRAAHVARGGSWHSDAGAVRTAKRGSPSPRFRDIFLGFRVASSVP